MPNAMFLRPTSKFRGIFFPRTNGNNPIASRGLLRSETGQDVYHGPLAGTFRKLKIFSLGSLGLTAVVTPFIFIIESTLPLSARVALAGVAMSMSGASTGLVSWCGAPYVTRLRRLGEGEGGIEMETATLFMRGRYTRVYDPGFLRGTLRPFAKWELAEVVEGGKEEKAVAETVAETRDGQGRVIGRWIVEWKAGRGECRGIGQIIRHYNIHEELLEVPLGPHGIT